MMFMEKKGQGGVAMGPIIGVILVVAAIIILAIIISKQGKQQTGALEQLPMLFILPKYLYNTLRQ